MRCQEEEEEGGDQVPGLDTRTGSTLLFSTTARFCDIKQRRNCSFLTSSSIGTVSMHDRAPPRPLRHFTLEPLTHRLAALIMANQSLALM